MNKSPDPTSLTRLELAELETFLWVVREGSFSTAARKLHLSQPAVTNRVRRLEDKLGVKLLMRTTRRVETTPDGLLLSEASEKAVAGLREVLGRFRAASDHERNTVTVAVTPMLSATVMPSLIHAYTQRYPDVRVVLHDLPYEQVLREVAEGRADLAVAALDGTPRGLRFQLLAEEPMLLVVPARHTLASAKRVTMDMILPYPLMMLDRYKLLWKRLKDEYAARGAPFNPASIATLPTLLGMIDAGNGITLLPRSMAQNNGRRTRITLEVSDLDASRRYGSLVGRKAELNAAASTFQTYLRKHFKATLESIA
ncbi:LysR family transcriptional regulator [Bordetella genomosp. 9]|uniref:LysR family transcriptional regulator n=1 Tax=Bordetella genomosp. 9 TaxID=1416803 RepID=A0A1W6YZY8_9BORD|nr:LysR family transcriptional regulator [Bordetella genomosp. 9]ARP86561.1 LysR family transcriptional regulator [Bordetella genomosp. 9]